MTRLSSDARTSAALAALSLAVFAPWAVQSGLHLDDHAFHRLFESGSLRELWDMFRTYVPGRNLYIPFSYALHRLCGGSPAAMHAVGALMEAGNAALVYALARALGARRGAAAFGSGLFLVWPNHGETHWWTSAIQMNVLSTSLALGAALAALRGRPWTAAALFAAALFDYDQVALLWVPVLLAARRASPASWPAGRLAAAATGCAALNAAHLLIRLLSPVSAGGRPVPRLGAVAESARRAIEYSFAPLRRWPDLTGFPGGLPAALLLAVLLAAAWLALTRRLPDEPETAPAEEIASLALLGAGWWACAYIPNLLWYISPRHNYLPSVGLALAAAAGLSSVRRRAPWRAAAGALFAASVLGAWSEGLAWAAAARELDRWEEAAPALVPADAEAVFLLGAPRKVRDAPAFFHPQEHLHGLARATGRIPAAGDVEPLVTRAGLFWGTETELFGFAAPSFTPLRETTLVVRRGDGSFERACSARLEAPGLAPRIVPFGRESCGPVAAIRVPTALLSVEARRSPAAAPSEARPVGARLDRDEPGVFELTLEWESPASPGPDFAAYIFLLDAAGAAVYKPEYSSPGRHAAAWPLFNDETPPSRWPPGTRVIERWRLEKPRAWSARPARARLVSFRREGGARWLPGPSWVVPLR